jgi:hypothetical protein
MSTEDQTNPTEAENVETLADEQEFDVSENGEESEE